MLLGLIEKTPDEVLDYDTGMWLWLGVGDALVSVDPSVEDSTVVVDSADVSTDTIKVRLSGGLDGESGMLRLLATTSLGLIKEVCYRLRVKDC